MLKTFNYVSACSVCMLGESDYVRFLDPRCYLFFVETSNNKLYLVGVS